MESSHKDDETLNLIECFLNTLSDNYEREGEINIERLADVAARLFEENQVKNITKEAAELIDNKDFKKVGELFRSYIPVESRKSDSVSLFMDYDAVRSACDYTKAEPLIEFGQGLGDFFGSTLQRGNLIAFMGANKSGKSFWLMNIAFEAMLQRKKVLYFEAGDMTKNQVITRFLVRAARRPARTGDIEVPVSFKCGDVRHDILHYEKPLNAKVAWEACQAVMENKVKSRKSHFELCCFPNSTLKISDMKGIITNCRMKGFTPDVVVCDYADILCQSQNGYKDGRDSDNDNWKGLRAISQEFDCLVLTATQANAKSFTAETLTRNNFAENRRKLDQVTGIIGINATTEERKLGLSRLNWLNLRDAQYDDSKCCHCAGSLALANPAMFSIY